MPRKSPEGYTGDLPIVPPGMVGRIFGELLRDRNRFVSLSSDVLERENGVLWEILVARSMISPQRDGCFESGLAYYAIYSRSAETGKIQMLRVNESLRDAGISEKLRQREEVRREGNPEKVGEFYRKLLEEKYKRIEEETKQNPEMAGFYTLNQLLGLALQNREIDSDDVLAGVDEIADLLWQQQSSNRLSRQLG